jgi:DNA-binding transcriptional regulator YiaG
MKAFGVALRDAVAKLSRVHVERQMADMRKLVMRLEDRIVRTEKRLAALARRKARGAAAIGKIVARGVEQAEMPSTEIQALRTRIGATQVQFAKLAGVTPVAVYFWESGRTRPRGNRLLRLQELRHMSRQDAAALLGEEPGGRKPGRKPGKRVGPRASAKSARRKAPARRS